LARAFMNQILALSIGKSSIVANVSRFEVLGRIVLYVQADPDAQPAIPPF
jgi:hypothetical protein